MFHRISLIFNFSFSSWIGCKTGTSRAGGAIGGHFTQLAAGTPDASCGARAKGGSYSLNPKSRASGVGRQPLIIFCSILNQNYFKVDIFWLFLEQIFIYWICPFTS